MKIAEYIELVKQAEDNTSGDNLIPLSIPKEGIPEEQRQVFEMGLNLAKNKANQTETQQFPIDPKTGLLKPLTPPKVPNTSNNVVNSEFGKVLIDPRTGQVIYNPPPGTKGVTNFLDKHLSPEFGKIYTGRMDGTRGWLSRLHPGFEGFYMPPPFELEGIPLDTELPLREYGRNYITKGPKTSLSSPPRLRSVNDAIRGVKNTVKSVANTPWELMNSLNAPVRFVDTSPIGIGFSLLAPAQDAERRAEIYAHDKMQAAGYTPSENIKLPLGYEVSPDLATPYYYYPTLISEYAKGSPQILPTFTSFSGPAAPVAIVSDLGINTPYRLMTGSNEDLVPGFWHSEGRPTRFRSNRDYEDEEGSLSQLGELLPDVLRTSDSRYGFGNLLADSAGGYIDPVMQFPIGWLYGDNMSNIAKLMDRPNAVSIDELGNVKVDYRDLFSNIFGSKGSYEQEGGRPELRNLPEHKLYWLIDELKEAAANMGYTRGEIENGVNLYANPNSLLYKGANLLKLMGMSAKDVYESPYMADFATEPRPEIPRYLPRRGGFYGIIPTLLNRTLAENPEWQRAKDALTRGKADQDTLFAINPFFKAVKGYASQMSPEEEDFLSNPDNIWSLGNLPTGRIIRKYTEDDYPITDKLQRLKSRIGGLIFTINTYKGPRDAFLEGQIEKLNEAQSEYNQLTNDLETNYYLNRLARLPYQYRYRWLINNPQYLNLFLDKYYTNEQTKKQISDFLIPGIIQVLYQKSKLDSPILLSD